MKHTQDKLDRQLVVHYGSVHTAHTYQTHSKNVVSTISQCRFHTIYKQTMCERGRI